MNEPENNELTTAQRDLVEQFFQITGADHDMAKRTLEACNWNLEMAINMHVDSGMLESNPEPIEIPPPASPVVDHPSASSSQSNLEKSDTESDVRAPIPSVRQVLVDDSYNHGYNTRGATSNPSVFDAFRDFRAEARWQEELQRDAQEGQNTRYSKKRTLEDLFRPPLDLMFRGSMDSAREEGVRQNKWLLVNIQNVSEFSCQVLNRDVWSNTAVKSIVSEHFIFWQVYHDSSEGQRYMQFYNVHSFPYVAILDPRTGEKLKSWITIDQVTFCDMITEFLAEHSSPNGNTNNSTVNTSSLDDNSDILNNMQKQQNLYEESEEAQLKAAIEASLKDSNSQNHHKNEEDEDFEFESFDSDSEEMGASKNNVNKDKSNDDQSWKRFVNNDSFSEISKLAIRFPDGQREQVSFGAEAPLNVLFSYIASKGYTTIEFDLITNFPKRNLKNLSSNQTLKEANIFPKETVFVQRKS